MTTEETEQGLRTSTQRFESMSNLKPPSTISYSLVKSNGRRGQAPMNEDLSQTIDQLNLDLATQS